jgi:hypothetical protein
MLMAGWVAVPGGRNELKTLYRDIASAVRRKVMLPVAK